VVHQEISAAFVGQNARTGQLFPTGSKKKAPHATRIRDISCGGGFQKNDFSQTWEVFIKIAKAKRVRHHQLL
jgi:hypothetical protein